MRLWRAGAREIYIDRPIVVGILNVTPDSFSDGGNFFAPGAAIERGAAMVAEGADIIDIGGESTRPGAIAVDAGEEVRRIAPVVHTIREFWPNVPISVDTTKASVASEALAVGADIINDVSGMRLDPEMVPLAASESCGVVIMHSRGNVEEMATYQHAVYGDDPMEEVVSELEARVAALETAGIARDRIVLDPGLGFSKTSAHSRMVLRNLSRLLALGCPVMAGPSRKRFVSERAGGASTSIEERDSGTVAACVMALERGARIFRVHNVVMARRALDVAWAVLNSNGA
ncbi:MAG TPA: dihydropteroate synthase [Gemmatimonadaceae bacterium]|nr:dihydropteroate synthase [Gemmatimonadaceae bacterium]